MNIQKLMRQAQQMQERMQRELETLVVEAGAGGGMVSVTMSGHKQLLSIRIDPEVLDPTDPAMVQDLVLAAVAEAHRQVDAAVQERLGGLGAGLPGLA